MHVTNGRFSGDIQGDFAFVGTQGNSVVDYCIVSSDIFSSITDFQVLPETVSDHLPIVTHFSRHFEIDQPEQHERNARAGQSAVHDLDRYVWDVNKRVGFSTCFEDNLKQNLEHFQHLLTISPNDGVTFLQQLFYNAFNESSMLKKKPATKKLVNIQPPWFDIDCRNAKKQKYTTLNLFRKSNQIMHKRQYITAKKTFK